MNPTAPLAVAGKPKLLDRLRHAVRVRHMARSTEKAYAYWCRRYILYHNKRHPLDMGKEEVEAFLTHLAVDQHVSASTQTSRRRKSTRTSSIRTPGQSAVPRTTCEPDSVARTVPS